MEVAPRLGGLLVRNLHAGLDDRGTFVGGDDRGSGDDFGATVGGERREFHVQPVARVGEPQGDARCPIAVDAEIHQQIAGSSVAGINVRSVPAPEGSQVAAEFHDGRTVGREHGTTESDAEFLREVGVGVDDSRFDLDLADRHVEFADHRLSLLSRLGWLPYR